MIGVVASPGVGEAVEEFFELFKTPWERAVPGKRYRAVLSQMGRPKDVDADLVLVYGAREEDVDRDAGISAVRVEGTIEAEWQGRRFPIYRGAALFASADGAVRHERFALDHRRDERGSVWRVGYDLFHEVRHLLTDGQPAEHAGTPTLDLHIALVRHLLQQGGVSFVEIPPRPHAHDFICCLTHDLDFFGLRRHAFDATLAGFVARASVGTARDLVRRKRSLSEARRNWAAVLSLPFVFTGLARDPWQPVDDYRTADRGRPSTFFVVPFKDRPGVGPDGRVQARRAVRYQASEVANHLAPAVAAGHEVALHGIDAWRDEVSAQAERAQIVTAGAGARPGVRMHWLYFDRQSPQRLEAAGFGYDSTCGYNDAVGYRAGTSQVFRLPGTTGLLELPISIMDTALFYRDRLNLPHAQALGLCQRIADHARLAGGTVVVNWHDRSLAPERLWGRAYDELLDELETAAPWFATAADAVDWFRWRRSIRFTSAGDGAVITCVPPSRPGLPAAALAVRRTSAPATVAAVEGGQVVRTSL